MAAYDEPIHIKEFPHLEVSPDDIPRIEARKEAIESGEISFSMLTKLVCERADRLRRLDKAYSDHPSSGSFLVNKFLENLEDGVRELRVSFIHTIENDDSDEATQ